MVVGPPVFVQPLPQPLPKGWYGLCTHLLGHFLVEEHHPVLVSQRSPAQDGDVGDPEAQCERHTNRKENPSPCLVYPVLRQGLEICHCCPHPWLVLCPGHLADRLKLQSV